MEKNYYVPSFCTRPKEQVDDRYSFQDVESIVWAYPYSTENLKYQADLFRFVKETVAASDNHLDELARSAVNVFIKHLSKGRGHVFRIAMRACNIDYHETALYFVRLDECPYPVKPNKWAYYQQRNYVWLSGHAPKNNHNQVSVEDYEVTSRLFIYCSFLFCALHLHNQYQGARHVGSIADIANKVICPASKMMLLKKFLPEAYSYVGNAKSRRVFKQFHEKLMGDVE